MKTKLIVLSLVLFSFVLVQPAHAYSLNMKLVNQDPFPAQRGEAVDLLFRATITNTLGPPSDLQISLFPKYPFSAVSDSTIDFGDVSAIPYDSSFTFTFRVLVDKNADEGDNEIQVGYNVLNGLPIKEKFNVSVAETRTDFDVIIDDVSDGTVSLGIVNSGKNPASSVVVRIPDQQGFDVSGLSSSIIGDLNKGDFSLADFDVAQNNGDNLKVEISYTDLVGNRYTLQKEVKWETVPQKAETNSGFDFGFWIGIIVIGAIVYFVYRHFKGKKK